MSTDLTLTPRERHIMVHACAWDEPESRGVCNHFFPAGESLPVCEALEARGLMRLIAAPSERYGGGPVYSVTEAGMAALGPSLATKREKRK